MSFHIVKRVNVNNAGVVTINSASNNVYPRYYEDWTMTYRHKDNPYTGKLSAEVEVFAGFEQGNFQGGNSKFVKQLEVLMNMSEYERFDWRADFETAYKSREDKKAYYELLAKAWQTPLPEPRYAITKDNYGQTVYGKYRKGGKMHWTLDPKQATLKPYKRDVERLKLYYNYSDNWQVVDLGGSNCL